MNAIAISTTDFDTMVDRARSEINPPGPGWGTYDTECPNCGMTVTGCAPIATRGFRCPLCGYFDPNYQWGLPEGSPKWDGAFLNPVGWELATINLN